MKQSIKKSIGFGFLLWLIPFLLSFLLYPIHQNNRPLFESIMPIIGTLLTVIFFNKLKLTAKKDGFVVGIFWMLLSLGLDSFVFIWGPLKMTPVAYLEDIGLSYLMFLIITTGISFRNVANLPTTDQPAGEFDQIGLKKRKSDHDQTSLE